MTRPQASYPVELALSFACRIKRSAMSPIEKERSMSRGKTEAEMVAPLRGRGGPARKARAARRTIWEGMHRNDGSCRSAHERDAGVGRAATY